MRQRLFWKILVGFWITFVVVSECIWLDFDVTHPTRADVEYGAAMGRMHLTDAAVALRYGGAAALDQVLASWSPADRAALVITPGRSAIPEQPRATVIVADVTDPSGAVQHLVYDWARRPRPPHGLLHTPWEVLATNVLGALAFSAILAWYLTQPIRKLRQGFLRLAGGDLGARLHGDMGRRRDEIADLARDFDVMAERLQQLVSARDQLLHDVSHELRSPLARLQVAIGLARQNPARFQAALDRIELEARRLDELVGELLTLSRVEGNVPHLDQYFDVADLVQTVASDARFEASHAGVEVQADLGDVGASAPPLKGSAELLRRGLDNVVRNAIRFSSQGQTVSMSLRREPEAYVIEVADCGPGVPEEALRRIFEPFVRLGDAHPRTGYGLGLAIAQRAASAHGGSISAANKHGGGLAVATGRGAADRLISILIYFPRPPAEKGAHDP
jgi:two-component system OmpR family sensor kinase